MVFASILTSSIEATYCRKVNSASSISITQIKHISNLASGLFDETSHQLQKTLMEVADCDCFSTRKRFIQEFKKIQMHERLQSLQWRKDKSQNKWRKHERNFEGLYNNLILSYNSDTGAYLKRLYALEYALQANPMLYRFARVFRNLLYNVKFCQVQSTMKL